MDFAIKIAVLVLVMVALYALSRSLSEPKESVSASVLTEPPDEARPTYDLDAEEQAVRPRVVDGTRIENYGFREIDLSKGPPDPEDFFDELFVQRFDETYNHRYQDSYTVCTPKGISRFRREKEYSSLLASGYIIVERYDIDLILNAILDPADRDDESGAEQVGDPDQLQNPRFQR